jgi:hypothetical protein
MTPNHLEVLSAFFDGEAVEPDLLAASLQEPGAAGVLVEFARLRRAVHEDAGRPTEEFCESMRETLARGEERRRTGPRLLQMSLAASLALAAALGGFSVHSLLDRQPRERVSPPGQARQASHEASRSADASTNWSRPDATGRSDAPPAIGHELPSPNLQMRFAEWQDTPLGQ